MKETLEAAWRAISRLLLEHYAPAELKDMLDQEAVNRAQLVKDAADYAKFGTTTE